MIFYNRDIFKKADIIPDKNWNIENFYANAKELKKYVQTGFCTEFDAVSWENFVSIDSKPIFTDEKLTIADKASTDALQKLSDKINEEGLGANKEQISLSPCAQLFMNQKTAMFVSGRWSVPKLNSNPKLKYGVLPFPKGQSKYYIPLNSSGWAVYKNSKNKDAAIDFVKYISSDENIEKMVNSGLITPANKKIADSNNFKNGEIFIDIIEKSTPNNVPADYNIIIDKVNNAAISVLGGYKTAKEAIEPLFKEY
ncbi:extracellular solute-binding protein [bacterium]|nr:extracellular solute-binding protein [bacterium]